MIDGKPLYKIVREHLLKRIRKGEWGPGEIIPNEFEIAEAYRVSQGTARKAISELASEGILTRQQGRGTFVTGHRADANLTRFSPFVDSRHRRIELRSLRCTHARGTATSEERKALGLAAGTSVLRLYRLRTFDEVAVMTEAITLPARQFRAFRPAHATDNLYDLYQRSFGIHVVRTVDRLSAVQADRRRAKELAVTVGTPLLRIDRVAFALGDQKVEWRVSLCNAVGYHYLSTTS